ncbi:MAG TPA: hypothetical protein VMU64_14880 [Acidimicrobiales bacterium]|nr:hypothetical protein [Acidimicrobiales bacterium]
MTRSTATPQRRALVALVLVAVGLSVTAGASALSPHADPAANLTLPSSLLATQQASCLSRPIDTSAVCTRALLAEVNYGLATEGLAPISLPSNWATLTVAEQIFVVVDLERVARGLQPFLGMSFIWGADAQMGAADNGDPPMPAGNPWIATEWAGGGIVSPLQADFIWMYDDGLGGPNIDCPSAGASGCWVHRDNILAEGSCTTCVVGAGYTVVNGTASMTAVLVEPADASTPLVFTWANNVVPYLGRATAPLSIPSAQPGNGGYREVAGDGGIFAFGASFEGSRGGQQLNAPIVGMAFDPWTGGYWEVASDGGVFAFNAPFFGSMGGQHLNAPIVGIAADVGTGGYWEVASDGGVFAFNAPFYGSMGGQQLNAPIVGIAPDGITGGYLEVARDGGVFSFHAPFFGSMGGQRLNAPIVGITLDPWTGGYWEVASDGGVFAFHAPFFGSMGGINLTRPVVGIAADPAVGGYWEVASDGGVFNFNATFFGSEGGAALTEPVVGIAP